jgi:hypothetical protein
MNLSNSWEIDADLSTQALLVSLQGLANRTGPNVYYVYPPEWTYTFTAPFKTYLEDVYSFVFDTLETPREALEQFSDAIHGYVIWDKEVRTSLMVAFTVAGLEDAVVVSETEIPLMEELGIPLVDDLRGRYTGQTDYEVFSSAYETYWGRTNNEFLVYIGGVGRNRMEAGIADMAVAKSAFVTDLSVDPADTLEYALSAKIFEEMEPWSFVLGWHSYVKDTEAQHLAQMSRYTLRQEGLNTFPNMSFLTHLKLPDGYKLANNHTVERDEKLVPGDKVYITCVQTDGLGIGAWFREGRGAIPYAWEIADGLSMELFPVLTRFFYETATPNDYFIGALSGPNYIYPKSVPPEVLPEQVRRAREQMDLMDLRVFGVMDYTEGNRYMGNIDLTRRIVDEYYRGMPDILGFMIGYGPAHTYDFRDGVPMISYDYYLSSSRPADDVVLDLQELATLNSTRPYFLAMHVRNPIGSDVSDVGHVKRILDRLGPEFELVPMDVFMKLAAAEPNFKTRHLAEREPGPRMVGFPNPYRPPAPRSGGR